MKSVPNIKTNSTGLKKKMSAFVNLFTGLFVSESTTKLRVSFGLVSCLGGGGNSNSIQRCDCLRCITSLSEQTSTHNAGRPTRHRVCMSQRCSCGIRKDRGPGLELALQELDLPLLGHEILQELRALLPQREVPGLFLRLLRGGGQPERYGSSEGKVKSGKTRNVSADECRKTNWDERGDNSGGAFDLKTSGGDPAAIC